MRESLVKLLLSVFIATSLLWVPSNSYIIGPGIGLKHVSADVEVVVFEHTDDFGTGGLVLNCPTPIKIGNLNIPKFEAFEELPLMLGNGITEMEEDSGEEYNGDISTISLGEVSPWFWLHDMDDLPGSYVLEQASGPLYMGGNIEEATKRLQADHINPKGRFKFFRKYISWKAGELQKALDRGEWTAVHQDPEQALKEVRPRIKLE